MDEGLKSQFDTLCAEFGMNATTAFNVFARAVVRERRIPFEICSDNASKLKAKGMQAFMELRQQARQNGIQDLSIEEINQEISNSRNGKL